MAYEDEDMNEDYEEEGEEEDVMIYDGICVKRMLLVSGRLMWLN